MAPGGKDLSEIVKNYITVAAILIGGLWVLYQWTSIFPKTHAENAVAAAGIRTEVAGNLALTIGRNSGEELELRQEGAPPESDPIADASQFCADKSAGRFHLAMPVAGQLSITSASAIPVRSEVKGIQVSRIDFGTDTLIVGEADQLLEPARFTSQTEALSPESFLGGLSWTRVEAGQTGLLTFVVRVNLPFDCAQVTQDWAYRPIFSFAVETATTAIDPSSNNLVGEAVPKFFISSCQIDPNGAAICNLDKFVVRAQ